MTSLVHVAPTSGAAVHAGSVPAWVNRALYPFEPRRLQLPAGQLSYVDAGSGEPILFVHGTPCWSFEYRHLLSGLVGEHRVVAFDQLGFGLSERPKDFAYTPEAHAANLQAAVDQLGLRDFTLVVHDLGGPIGLPLALNERNRVRRLVVLNTFLWPLEDKTQLRLARVIGSPIGRFLYRYFNASLRLLLPGAYGDKKKLTPEIHRHYLNVFPDFDSRERVLWALARALIGSREFYVSLWQQREKLRDLPTQLIWGLKDPAFPAAFLERFQQAWPHARVTRLPHVGHSPQEEDPASVLAALRTW